MSISQTRHEFYFLYMDDWNKKGAIKVKLKWQHRDRFKITFLHRNEKTLLQYSYTFDVPTLNFWCPDKILNNNLIRHKSYLSFFFCCFFHVFQQKFTPHYYTFIFYTYMTIVVSEYTLVQLLIINHVYLNIYIYACIFSRES